MSINYHRALHLAHREQAPYPLRDLLRQALDLVDEGIQPDAELVDRIRCLSIEYKFLIPTQN